MSLLKGIHHVAIICSNYERSKHFYVSVLGFTIINETYRKDRDSYKLDLAINNDYLLELFSFPEPPPRQSRPEASGLRHLAFKVADLDEAVKLLKENKVRSENIRLDEFTNKRFTFIFDPDELPIELYEM
ncbi:MAG: VOC family protein [bacterium]|nr:VOC family protein [bacterium]